MIDKLIIKFVVIGGFIFALMFIFAMIKLTMLVEITCDDLRSVVCNYDHL